MRLPPPTAGEAIRTPPAPWWTVLSRRRSAGRWRMSRRYSPEPLRLQVGILLSGCGHFDGSDVQEAVLCGLALDRRGAKTIALAPQRPQLHVVDHTVGDESAAEARDIYLESSRIL